MSPRKKKAAVEDKEWKSSIFWNVLQSRSEHSLEYVLQSRIVTQSRVIWYVMEQRYKHRNVLRSRMVTQSRIF